MKRPQLLQTIRKGSRKLIHHPVLDVPVLQNIGYPVYQVQERLLFRFLLSEVLPQLLFAPHILRSLQFGTARKPMPRGKCIQMRLPDRKIGIENVPQLMCKQSTHNLIAILAPAHRRYKRISRIDFDGLIVRLRNGAGFR